MPKPTEPFACTERVRQGGPSAGVVHPGWTRATAILLRGLARLEAQDLKAQHDETPAEH